MKKGRCPKGTKRNKKTGECDPIHKTKNPHGNVAVDVDIQKDLITIPNTNTKAINIISDAMEKLTKSSEDKKPLTPKQEVEQLQTIIKSAMPKQPRNLVVVPGRLKSFSPEVNKLLTTMVKGSVHDIFGCPFNANNPKINLGTTTKLKCVIWSNKEAKKKLLKNLDTRIDINCGQVIAPKQVKANCWFNTFFMTFFISDKGRKFFRYFRRLMIKGEQGNGNIIEPQSLRKSFFLLNMAIEASININESNNLLLLNNTNQIIGKITSAVKLGAKDQGLQLKTLPKEGKWGNPLTYYMRLMTYLNDTSLIRKSYSWYAIPDFFNERVGKQPARGHAQYKYGTDILTRDKPEMFTLEISDDEKVTNKKLSFHIDNKQFKAKYQLDSIIIRNVTKAHFSSLITCNGKEYGFDGGSYKKMERWDWKNMINKDQNWTFEGSHTNWNFCKGYMMLFYYRVS